MKTLYKEVQLTKNQLFLNPSGNWSQTDRIECKLTPKKTEAEANTERIIIYWEQTLRKPKMGRKI